MLLKYRILGGAGALLLVGSVGSAGFRGAASKAVISDTITFDAQAFIAVPPTATAPGFASIVSTKCHLHSDGEKTIYPCKVTGSATLTLTGGTLTGTISSPEGIIDFNETFVNTGRNGGTGTGTDTEFDFDDRSSSTGTFTAQFETSPTPIANILNDHAVVVVRELPSAGDPT